MKKISSVLGLVVLISVVLSCSLINRFNPVSTEGWNRTNELWPDVPRMDGFQPSDMEMPLTMKIILRTALNNLWRLNKEGEDRTPATGDWTVFTTSGTPAEVENFYTNARMTSFGGWEASDKRTCFDGKERGISGVLCVFMKVADKKEIGLAIIAGQDEKAKQTNVFFLRVERPETDADNSQSKSATVSRPAAGPITKFNGTAPYGIESRPMPSGTAPDRLLPKQVGSYTRTLLEKSSQRGVTPTEIEMDGNSVYATYRSGDKEVFVELGVSSRPEGAEESLNVALGDAAGGVRPTDPRHGSFGTEPSYLKVVNSDGAFFAWTRGGYYISANAKGGEADLDAFMNAFPY